MNYLLNVFNVFWRVLSLRMMIYQNFAARNNSYKIFQMLLNLFEYLKMNSKHIFINWLYFFLFFNLKLSYFQDLQPDEICYEPLEDYDRIRDNAKFWLEGVAILFVGIFGLFGNLLSIFIWRRSRGNKGFNTLLVM